MSTFTKERLQWLANISDREDIDDIDGEEIRELARIALESREISLPPKAPENLASCLDGYEKWLVSTTFRDTWNACLA
ncbi:hypothetical protein ACWASM_002019, partial [Enterobacter cloacae]